MDKVNLLEFYLNSPDFKVKHDKESDLYCIKYTNLSMDWDDHRYVMARGIILDKKGTIVSKGYDKFFNYLELENRNDISKKDMSRWSDSEFVVTEKIDGSMVLCTIHENKVLVSSSSSITNEFTELFKQEMDRIGLMNPSSNNGKYLRDIGINYSLVLEYVSPTTRIVIPYERPQLIFHGLVNKRTLNTEYLTEAKSREIARKLGVKSKLYYDLSKDEILHLQKSKENFEGWVVQFKDGKMIKIKTDWYIENHKVGSFFFGSINTKNKRKLILSLFKRGELDDLIAYSNQTNRKRESEILSKSLILIEKTYHKYEKIKNEMEKLKESGLSKDDFARKNNMRNKENIIRVLFLDNFDKSEQIDSIIDSEIIDNLKEIFANG